MDQPTATNTPPTPPTTEAGVGDITNRIGSTLHNNAVASGHAKNPLLSANAKRRPRVGGRFAPTKTTTAPPIPGQEVVADQPPPSLSVVAIPGTTTTDTTTNTTAAGGEKPTPPTPEEASAREDLGKVVVDTVFNVAQGVAGDKASPTNEERTSLRHYAGRTFGGMEIPAFVALALVAVGFLIRVVFKNRLAKKNEQPLNPSTDSRQEPIGQDNIGQTISQGNSAFG